MLGLSLKVIVGYNLCENWEDSKKVTEAIKLGDSSKGHYIVGDKIDFDYRSNPMYEVQNCYYGRDRGETLSASPWF